MTAAVNVLITELKAIRKGRGVRNAANPGRLGTQLSLLCGVDSKDGPETTVSKVTATLSALMTELQKHDADAVGAALGIGSEYADKPLLVDRISAFAATINVDPRTARRRVDDALLRLAEVTEQKRTDGDETASTKRGWHARSVRAIVLLSSAGVEVLELRTVVSELPDLRSIYLGFSTPPANDGAGLPQKRLEIDALFGGDIVERRIETSARTGFALQFPRPLKLGEVYEYGVRFRLPPDANVRPYYVLVPVVLCEEFDLRVKFEKIPAKVELLSGVFQADTQDYVLDAPAVEIDTLGEVRAKFRQLQPGMAYGLRWSE